ncbi:MAG TPA: FG-GAP-like repeat-containing protein, partial [bacterium]|nr:FG-GAP-like repeat-containing protein [bacterium]HOL36058.1 FG-GAP-like repeat-containing protein [bacterium]
QTYQWDAWPSEEVWRRGIQWRAQQAGVIYIHSHEGLEALKEHIAGGNLAVITTHVYSNFDQYPNGEYTNNDVLYAYTTTGYRGGHALTVVGYDDNKQYFDAIEGKNKKGAFLCVNSWGTNWGVFVPEAGSAGFIWLPYDFFLQKKNGDPEALILIDRINYHPEITATIGINHTRGRKLLLRIYAGEKNYPGYPAENKRWVKDAMPVSNDYPLQNSRIVVDLTDFADYENLTWYLEIMQLQMYSGTGEINYFAIQKGNKLPIESASVPQSPQTNWYIWLKAGLFSDAGDIFGSLKVRRGSIAWADFNKDGKVDLLITGYDWKTGSAVPVTFLFINRGDGTFQQAITANLPQLGNSIIACADYDNDSYPDVAIYGYNPQTDSNILKIYRNNGNNTFSDTAINLSHQEIIDMCWIDYDNDGKMDLTLSTENNVFLYKNCGNNNFGLYVQPLEITGSLSCADYDKDGWIDLLVSGTYKTAIYKNTGDGIFVETYSDFPGLRQASIAWADYDNDGNIDLALSGRLEDYTPFTGIYKNNGNNNFTYVETQITPVFAGSIVFADINNDGYRDLVMTGRTEDEFSTRYLGNYPNCSIVYLNDRHGNFFNAMAELLGVSIADMTCIPDYNNTLAVIDYDNDGDNDIFLSGTNTYMYTTTPSHIYTGIQKSLIANNEWDISNTPAQPPSNLSAIAGWENGSIVLQWQPGTDSETPSAGLYYHVRVGTATGSDNIVSSINGLIYPGQVILQDTKFLLTGLAPGTYYWSVQTIDAGMKVSAWSAESSFVIPSYTQKYNLHISSQQPYFGTTNPSPGVYSYNSGTNVQISAIPYGGYTFSRWSGDIENTQQNPVNVNMNRPRIITANFTLLYDISPQWEQKIDYTPWGSAQFHS